MEPKSTLVLPTGEMETVETYTITAADATLLRQYKAFLKRYHLREALYCQDCWNGGRADGCEAHVTETSILIRCRCALRTHSGLST